jgi:hypothetical protein
MLLGGTQWAGPVKQGYHRGICRRCLVADPSTENELMLTVALLILLALAVILIANLIGAIHVIG